MLDGAFRKSHANVTRWFQTIVNQPAAKEVLGDVKLADKVAKFNGMSHSSFFSDWNTIEQSAHSSFTVV